MITFKNLDNNNYESIVHLNRFYVPDKSIYLIRYNVVGKRGNIQAILNSSYTIALGLNTTELNIIFKGNETDYIEFTHEEN